MNRRQTLIHGLLCLITAGIPVGLILAAPVMREPRAAPKLDWVCHTDLERIAGEPEPVEITKCHEEAID